MVNVELCDLFATRCGINTLYIVVHSYGTNSFDHIFYIYIELELNQLTEGIVHC